MYRGRFAGVPRVVLSAFCCYKFSAKIEKVLPLQVTAKKVMTFFWKSAPFGTVSRDFQRSFPRKVVISNRSSSPFSLSPVMPLDINWNRFQYLVCRVFVQLISCSGTQKSLRTTALGFFLFFFDGFEIEIWMFSSQVIN